MAGSGAAVLVLALGGYLLFGKSSGTANVVSNDLITTFLPGEVQQVPNACTAPSSATLQASLPGGTPKVVAPPLNGGLESQCSWTLDAAPVYRVVELDVHAYSPSGLASGDGSATFAAIDAYAEAEQAKQNPGKKSGIPAASVTTLPGLGDSAFVATQVFNIGGTVTDMVTEVVRYRNVLVTVVVNGLDQKTGTKKYGPVSMSDLTTAAKAAAQDATAKVKAIH
jgi:hypothetical protein